MNISYNKKTEEQINQFRSVENIHELPDIFHYWSNKYLIKYDDDFPAPKTNIFVICLF